MIDQSCKRRKGGCATPVVVRTQPKSLLAGTRKQHELSKHMCPLAKSIGRCSPPLEFFFSRGPKCKCVWGFRYGL